ncbi:MAG: hypothetical protein GKS07_07640 [Nitrosopumilus sp.]|nr:MAG: hypothetical protein GKS07_07640 [Nitrosopumilus sp.]
MKAGILILLAVASVGLLQIPESSAENSASSCNLRENLRNQDELVKDDMVLEEFLRLFPDARVARTSSVEQTDPPQISVTWYAKDVYFFSILILEHDKNDPLNCFVPGGYRLNAPHLPPMTYLFYHDDPKRVLEQIREMESKHIRGDDPELLQLKEKIEQIGTEYRIKFEHGDVFGDRYIIENAIVHDVSFDWNLPSSSLIFTLQESEKGNMLVEIASGLLYPVHREYQSRYTVEIDGIDAPAIQHSPTVLEIPFQEGTKEIRIAGDYYGGVKCQSETVRKKYDSHDAVIHGIVINRESPLSSNTILVTVDVVDTFKGKTDDSVVISVEGYHHSLLYEDFGYVLFLNENDSGHEIPPCTPAYHALQSIISSMHIMDESFMDTLSHMIEEEHQLSKDEMHELEKIHQVERKLQSMEIKERDKGYEIFWTLVPVVIIASIGVAIFFIVRILRK